MQRMRGERKRKSTKAAFNQTTSTEIHDFNTPLNNDKRSRSLISVRRRHWSGSSNRSTSTTHNSQQHRSKINK